MKSKFITVDMATVAYEGHEDKHAYGMATEWPNKGGVDIEICEHGCGGRLRLSWGGFAAIKKLLTLLKDLHEHNTK